MRSVTEAPLRTDNFIGNPYAPLPRAAEITLLRHAGDRKPQRQHVGNKVKGESIIALFKGDRKPDDIVGVEVSGRGVGGTDATGKRIDVVTVIPNGREDYDEHYQPTGRFVIPLVREERGTVTLRRLPHPITVFVPMEAYTMDSKGNPRR